MYCSGLSLSYLQVGTLHQHYYGASIREDPSSEDIVILISRFLYSPDISTTSGLFLVQILHYSVLIKLHRIQAGDKLR